MLTPTRCTTRPRAMTTPLARHLTTWPERSRLDQGSVVTMGVFDGFHRGHQVLVERARAHAAALMVPSVLLTFDPHPLALTCPERVPRPLLTVEERVETALELGIDHVLVLPFNRHLAMTSAEDFVRHGLVDRLSARHVVVGANFRFGRGGAGDSDYLRIMGVQHGFTTESVPLVDRRGRVCSSTTIRNLLAAGDVAAASDLLGTSAERVLRPVAAGAVDH